MNTYYIRAETEEGEDMSLIVHAPTKPAAIHTWAYHYDLCNYSDYTIAAAAYREAEATTMTIPSPSYHIQVVPWAFR